MVDPASHDAVPATLPLLAAAAALYACGVARVWRRAGAGRGIGPHHVACFTGGWVALVLALLSPIDTLSQRHFWAHMVQHELLMVVAAPLVVLGRPLEAWTWALPRQWRGISGIVGAGRRLGRLGAPLAEPLPAWALHAVALWAWHAPPLFERALVHDGWHVAQHATFLATALLFWRSVLEPGLRRSGAPLASVFTTMLHTGALGALLTFSPTPWYPGHAAAAAAAGGDALADQQLGGLVMWVPAGLAYLAAALAIAASWLARVSPQRE